MPLYLLKSITPAHWDEADGFIIRAATPAEARSLAQDNGGNEVSPYSGEELFPFWTNPLLTTCEELSLEGPTQVILRDFHHG